MLLRTHQTFTSVAVCVLLSLAIPTAAAVACPGGGGGGGAPANMTLSPDTPQRFENVRDRKTFTFNYREGPAARFNRRLVPNTYFSIESDSCPPNGTSISPPFECIFNVRKDFAGETVTLTVELAPPAGVHREVTLIG